MGHAEGGRPLLANPWIITAVRTITNLGNVWKQEVPVQRVASPDTAAATLTTTTTTTTATNAAMRHDNDDHGN
jgi:hypothetical protein